MTGAEVVDGEPDAERAQLLQRRDQLGGVAHQRGLGELEDEPGGATRGAQQDGQPSAKPGALQLARGDVDGDGRRRGPRPPQVAASATARVRAPSQPSSSISELCSATATKSAGGTSPRSGSCQRTSASTPTTRPERQVDDRLVVHLQGPVGERPAQVDLEVVGVARGAVLVRGEQADAAAAGAPWRVHRGVGVPQQRLGRSTPGPATATPALPAGTTSERASSRTGSRSPSSSRSPTTQRLLGRPHAVAEHDELVAAEAGDHVARAQHGLQPGGDGDEQPVAGGVARARR